MADEFYIYTTSLECRKEQIIFEGDAITISGSVGRGGANRPNDVRTIQEALNGVSLDEGGPLLGLVVDGIVGRKTIEAIERFQQRQLGWSDGRVDTNKQTIAALNAVAGGGDNAAADVKGGKVALAVGAKKPKPKIKRRKFEPNPYIPMLIATMMPDVLGCIHAAQTNLLAVRLALTHKRPSTIPWFDPAQLMVPLQIHFKIAEPIVHHQNPIQPVDYILGIFNTMARALARGMGSTYFEAPPTDDENVAYTIAGGYYRQGQLVKSRPEQPRADTIYVTPLWLTYRYEYQVEVLVHELAHFCGPKSGPMAIEDYAYLHQGPKYEKLRHRDCLRNAESYAAYAFRCRYGRNPTLPVKNPKYL